MISSNVGALQAMAGRFLTTSDLFAWEASSRKRCTDLVRGFQQKALDGDGLRAALSSERIGGSPSPSAASSVAVLGLFGVLMPTPSIFSMLGFGTSVRTFMQHLSEATFDPKVKGIVVLVDSPGGSVRLIPEAAAAMRQARQRKPTVVSVAGLAASAAYWIASNATAIEATPSASIGAIGIITERVSIKRQLEAEGIDVHVVSAGKYKHEGHPALAPSEAELKALDRRVQAANSLFVNDVAAGRHVTATTVASGYAEGRLVETADALRFGMIDRVATVDETLARAIQTPALLTAVMNQRVEHARDSANRLRADQGRAEIGSYRARIRAAMHGSAMG